MVGTSGAWSWKSLLIKWELGAQIERSFNVDQPSELEVSSGVFVQVPGLGVGKGSTIDTMLGLTYTPVADLQLALEFSKSSFVDEPDGLVFPVDQPTFAFRAMYKMLRDTLTFSAAVSMFGIETADEIGFVARAEVSYDIMDGVQIGGGYVHYHPSEDLGFLSGLGDHDQIFLKFRYDFLLL